MILAAIFLFLFSCIAHAGQSGISGIIPTQVYAPGTYEFTSASLANETDFYLKLTTVATPVIGTRLSMAISISPDNGKTFVTRYVLVWVADSGSPFVAVWRNTQTATTRRVKFSATITGGSINMGGNYSAK